MLHAALEYELCATRFVTSAHPTIKDRYTERLRLLRTLAWMLQQTTTTFFRRVLKLGNTSLCSVNIPGIG